MDQGNRSRRRAVIYTRVSTNEQAERGYSLRAQEERLCAHCRHHGIEVVAHFQDDASAKSFEGRPGFQEALVYLRKHKTQVDYLLFDRWDRFSRDALEALSMGRELRELGIEYNAIQEPIDDDNPASFLMQLIHLGIAETDNRMKSKRVKEGMRRAMKEGRWVNRAPIGYSSERTGKAKPELVQDGRAPLVREAFELYSAGHLTVEEVRRKLGEKGLKLSRSKFPEMLRSPLYTGKIRIPAWRDELEEVVDGRHEQIVDEALYNRVQNILDNRNARKAGKSPRIRPELSLRGFLECERCGGRLTGGRSRGNGGVYWYYHCYAKACKGTTAARIVHEGFENRLRELTVPPEVAELYIEILKDVENSSDTERSQTTVALNLRLAELEGKLGEADVSYFEGQLEKDSYERVKQHYMDHRSDALAELARLEARDNDLVLHARFGLSLLSDLPNYWASAPIDVKREIVGLMFNGILVYEKLTLRTPNLHPIFDLFNAKKSEYKQDRPPEMVTGPEGYRVRDLNPCYRRERAAS